MATNKKKSGKKPAKKIQKKATGKKPKGMSKKIVKAAKSAKKAVVAKGKKISQVKTEKAARKPAMVSARLITPLEDRLLVASEGESEITPGGIYIPATAAGQRPHRGEVLAVGPGRRNKKGQLRPLDVNAGDMVLFNEFAGTKVAIDGKEYLILREEDVLGIAT